MKTETIRNNFFALLIFSIISFSISVLSLIISINKERNVKYELPKDNNIDSVLWVKKNGKIMPYYKYDSTHINKQNKNER